MVRCITYNHNPDESLADSEAVLERTNPMQPNTARHVVRANALEGQRLRMATAILRLAEPESQQWPRRLWYRDSRRPALTRMQRAALKMQDALDGKRSELTEAATPGLASSSFSRAVSRWLANSRWLRVGSSRPNRASLRDLVAPNPIVDALCHLPKVSLAALLLGCLRMMNSCSYRVACADAPNDPSSSLTSFCPAFRIKALALNSAFIINGFSLSSRTICANARTIFATSFRTPTLAKSLAAT